MRLRPLQITLWIAAILATVVFAWSRWPAGDVAETEPLAAFEPSFALADGEGKPRTSAEFRGSFQLVFFGFTLTDLGTRGAIFQQLDNHAAHADLGKKYAAPAVLKEGGHGGGHGGGHEAPPAEGAAPQGGGH